MGGRFTKVIKNHPTERGNENSDCPSLQSLILCDLALLPGNFASFLSNSYVVAATSDVCCALVHEQSMNHISWFSMSPLPRLHHHDKRTLSWHGVITPHAIVLLSHFITDRKVPFPGPSPNPNCNTMHWLQGTANDCSALHYWYL